MQIFLLNESAGGVICDDAKAQQKSKRQVSNFIVSLSYVTFIYF